MGFVDSFTMRDGMGSEYFCIVMEYCEGGNLRDFILKHGGHQANLECYLLLLEQMAEGLAVIHGKRQMHRDIKPENVFLRVAGITLDALVPKLGDFGEARDVISQAGVASYTKCVGTELYMAPELIDDEPYGTSSDVWALGIVLYEMLSGKHPFARSKNFHRNIQAIINDDPPPLSAWVPDDVA